MSESFELTLKELYRIHWYDTFLFLAVACLSFADPITDVLTLIVFYRWEHYTWFAIGLVFVILPCLMYPFVYHFSTESADRRDMSAALNSGFKLKAKDFLYGLHPFSPSLARSQAFIICLKHFKKLWNMDYKKTQPPPRPDWANSRTDALLLHNKLSSLFEGLLESAPQIIIQLYAIGVQDDPLKIIQMLSLPVSILSLLSTFTTADEMLHDDEIGVLDLKHKLLLFVTQIFVMTSRLCAITFFMVTYKWWIICVVVFHSISLLSVDAIWYYLNGKLTTNAAIIVPCFSLLNLLRDDMTLSLYFDAEAHDANTRRHLVRMQCLCNILFTVENIVMISLYYYGQTVNTWYSLPITVTVALLSCLGAMIRTFHFKFLRRNYAMLCEELSPELESLSSAEIPTLPVKERETTTV